MTTRPGDSPPPSGLLHATVVASDLPTSLAFYDAVLGVLGIARHSEFPDEEEEAAAVDAVGYGPSRGRAEFWVVAGPRPTTGAHFAFVALTPAAVDRFWIVALANGGRGSQAPRGWEIYRPGYYGSLVADPDGNLIEAVFAG